MNKIDYSKTNFNSIKGIPEVIARSIWRESRHYYGNTRLDLPSDITKINGVTVAHLVEVRMVSDYSGRGYEEEMWTNIKQPTFKFEVLPAIKVCRIDYQGLSKFRILVARDLLHIYGPYGPTSYVDGIMLAEYNTLEDVYKVLDEINAFIEYETSDCCVRVRDITRYYLGAKIQFLVDDIFSTIEDAYTVGNEAVLAEAKRSFDAYKKNRADELRKVHSKYSKNLNTIRKKVDAITSAFSKISGWEFVPPKPQKCPTSTPKKEEKVLGKLDITVTVTAEE